MNALISSFGGPMKADTSLLRKGLDKANAQLGELTALISCLGPHLRAVAQPRPYTNEDRQAAYRQAYPAHYTAERLYVRPHVEAPAAIVEVVAELMRGQDA